jgi:hypothetical protein
VLNRRIDWFVLQGGSYVALAPDTDGVITSAAFPGLRLDVEAMLRGDKARVLSALDLPADPAAR